MFFRFWGLGLCVWDVVKGRGVLCFGSIRGIFEGKENDIFLLGF